MFSDPQFWVAVSFFLFIAAIFNPVKKILTSSLDSQIVDIKNKIEEAEKLKVDAQKTLSELKLREAEVEKEINQLKSEAKNKINELEKSSGSKLLEQIEKRKLLADVRIDQLLRDTNSSIKDYISNAAIEATTNILNKNLTKEKRSELIEESVKDLKNVIKN